jgi:class 3 adenylate cyclase
VQPLGLEIRAGLHTGTCQLVDGHSLAGLTVHIGARIGSRATASEVLASRHVAELCTGTQLRFASVGSTDLNGVPDPVEIVRLLPDGPPSPAADTGRRLRRLDRLSLGIAKGAPSLLRGAAKLAGART